ncbi:MAG: ISKra4 family transposase [Pseudomonadales bacterium]
MKMKVQVIIESDEGQKLVEDVASLARGALSAETLGLSLVEAKQVLQHLQASIVNQQVLEYLQTQRCCPHCGRPRSLKGHHAVVFRTVFGKLSLPSPRLRRCACEHTTTRSFSPLAALLPERSAPELAYLEAKWASLMSYGLTVDLLTEVLPLDGQINTTSVRLQLQRVAERAEAELGPEHFSYIYGCPRDWAQLPRPDPPITVGIDGGYVRGRRGKSRSEGHFEVIAGKSMADDGSKYFAFVNRHDTKPKRRLFEVLKSQGMQMNQQVTFLSDGGDTVRNLQLYLNPQAEHVLNWFHCTMRLTVMRQMAKGVRSKAFPNIAADARRQLDRIKWYLWHGNVFRTLQTIEYLQMDIENIEESEARSKLLKALREFNHYIDVNKPFIPNYGDRYRNGENIATGVVESTVNQVISKRLVKKQQMRWTERGAHLLLQVRTKTLNDELRPTFEGWYPGMKQAA